MLVNKTGDVITEEVETEEVDEGLGNPTEEVEDLDDSAEDSEDENESEDEEDSDDDDLQVSFGDEDDDVPKEEKAPGWVKNVRKDNREKAKRIKQLEQELAERTKAETQPVLEEKKPTAESCGYDLELYEEKLDAWHRNAKKREEAEAAQRAQEEAQEAQWKQRLELYDEGKESLEVQDYEDVEDVVKTNLDETQHGIIIHTTANPALFTYAIGKSEARAKKLAKIKDPLKLAYELGKMESKMTVEKRKPRTSPEDVVVGDTTTTGSTDRTLDRLRAKAAKTGNFSEVIAYKRKKRNAAKK